MYMRRFNDYFTRLGYLLSESREMADTLVIHPLHAGYTVFKRLDRDSTRALNAAFTGLVEKLGDEKAVASHFVALSTNEAEVVKFGTRLFSRQIFSNSSKCSCWSGSPLPPRAN